MSHWNSDTSFDSCVLNRTTDDETYYPSTSDDSSNEDFRTNVILRPHQKHNNYMCVQQISDPLTVEEALSSTDAEYWKAAMDEEYQTLLE